MQLLAIIPLLQSPMLLLPIQPGAVDSYRDRYPQRGQYPESYLCAGCRESGNITFTLTATGSAPCGTVKRPDDPDHQIHRPRPMPEAIWLLAKIPPIQIAGATAQNYSSILWTTNGTGSFIDPAVLNPVYTPSAADVSTGIVVLTMNVGGITPCADVSDQLLLSIIQSPQANAGNDAATCEGASYTLNGTSASYYSTLLWTLTPLSGGTITVLHHSIRLSLRQKGSTGQ